MTEAKEASIFWDFKIQTDRKKNNKQDKVVKDYERKKHTKKAMEHYCYYHLSKIVIIISRKQIGSACGVMGIVVGNGHGDTSSNTGRD